MRQARLPSLNADAYLNDGAWSVETMGEGDLLRMECVDASMTLDEVYEDVP